MIDLLSVLAKNNIGAFLTLRLDTHIQTVQILYRAIIYDIH